VKSCSARAVPRIVPTRYKASAACFITVYRSRLRMLVSRPTCCSMTTRRRW